ncbi:Hypothetical protein FKW44_005964, partial [Caligus rogercresseyi]
TLKDGKGTGRTIGSGGASNKGTEDCLGKVKEAVKEDPTKLIRDWLGSWMSVLLPCQGL